MDKLILSGSRLDTLSCARRYYHSYEDCTLDDNQPGLELIEAAPRLLAGTAFHAGLDVWYTTSETKRLVLGQAALANSWGDYRTPPAHPLSFLGQEFLSERFAEYDAYWSARETFTPIDVRLPNGQRICSEEMVVAEFDTPDHQYSDADNRERQSKVRYRGRLDLPAVDSAGQIYVVDHKCTTGNMGSYFFNSFRISNKLRGYCNLLQDILQKPVAGAVVNGIYIGKQQRKPDAAFQRQVFNFGPSLLEEHRQNAASAELEIRWRREHNIWPQTTDGRMCANCDFLRICQAPQELRLRIIERYYRTKEPQ